MEPSNNTQAEVRHPKVGYEIRDLDYRAIFLFLAILAAGGLIAHIGVWAMFEELAGRLFVPHQTTNPIMTSNEELRDIGGDPALTMPMPRLQPDPVADLNKFRNQEDEELNSYGWVDQQAGKIHIPVERAIEILGDSWSQQQSIVSGSPEANTNASPLANTTATRNTGHSE